MLYSEVSLADLGLTTVDLMAHRGLITIDLMANSSGLSGISLIICTPDPSWLLI
jgi:hypothetical protein